MTVKSENLRTDSPVRNFCWLLCTVKFDLSKMKLGQEGRSNGTWADKLGGLRFSCVCLPWKGRRNALEISAKCSHSLQGSGSVFSSRISGLQLLPLVMWTEGNSA